MIATLAVAIGGLVLWPLTMFEIYFFSLLGTRPFLCECWRDLFRRPRFRFG
jgi:hypothetical protein